jgi:IS30 family transposase
MLVALPGGHTAEAVTSALSDAVTTLPVQLRRSLTWDQGKEMAGHAPVHRGNQSPGLFLRSAFAVAVRQQ